MSHAVVCFKKHFSGAKALTPFASLSARLKSCPDTKQMQSPIRLGSPRDLRSGQAFDSFATADSLRITSLHIRQGLKPRLLLRALLARLKPCPYYKALFVAQLEPCPVTKLFAPWFSKGLSPQESPRFALALNARARRRRGRRQGGRSGQCLDYCGLDSSFVLKPAGISVAPAGEESGEAADEDSDAKDDAG